MNFAQIFAITEKELKLNMRYKYYYFVRLLFNPLKFILFFGVVYWGIFHSGTQHVGEMSKYNYVSFLVLGGLTYTFFAQALTNFESKFMREKFWQTMPSFLIAPVHRLKLIIGIGLSELLGLCVASVLYLTVSYFFVPVSFINLLLVVAVIILLFFGTLGIGLIQGVFALVNENLLIAFEIFFWAWSFLSCFYYPITSLPKFIHPLVVINPVYQGLTLIRNLWFNMPTTYSWDIILVVGYAVFFPALGVFLFNRLIKRIGISGY